MRHNLQKVIQIGEELFRSKGYYDTGTKEILEQSGLPRSSFYYHFTSKEGFAGQVIATYGDNAVKFYEGILLNKDLGNPRQRFQLLFSQLIQLTVEKDFKSQCLVQKMSGECAGSNETIRKATLLVMTKMLAVFQVCIREGQLSGVFRNDIDADQLAHFLHAQIYGAHTLVRLSKSAKALDDTLQILLDFICHQPTNQ